MTSASALMAIRMSGDAWGRFLKCFSKGSQLGLALHHKCQSSLLHLDQEKENGRETPEEKKMEETWKLLIAQRNAARS